jgi:hypothetical protein
MENYGQEYWNDKWPKSPILYSGRTLKTGKDLIAIDVKTFMKVGDALVEEIVKKYQLQKSSYNETALACQRFVCKFLTYKYDDEANNCPEFWQYSFETLQSGVGDCEDGAILIANLCINAGIPEWRVKVAAGNVKPDPKAPEGGHAYCIYLADRKDSNRSLEFINLDWCYLPDEDLPIEKKPLSNTGGTGGTYKEIWFTFNSEYSWNLEGINIEGRVSNNMTTLKEEVVNNNISIESVMKFVASKMA